METEIALLQNKQKMKEETTILLIRRKQLNKVKRMTKKRS